RPYWLGNEGAASIHCTHRPDHKFRGLIIVLADKFKTFDARSESDPPPGIPRRSVGARIIDRHFVLYGAEVGAREAFDGVQFVRMRHTFQIRDPHPFVVSDGVYDQGIALKVADAVTVIAGRQILRMTTAIHVDGTEAMRSTRLKDNELLELRKMDKLSP